MLRKPGYAEGAMMPGLLVGEVHPNLRIEVSAPSEVEQAQRRMFVEPRTY